VAVEPATPPQVQAARQKWQTLRQAIARGQETTVAFTAGDLNALIAGDPAFASLRDHAHVSIADSLITLELSAQITGAEWKGLEGRWFNGRVQFGFSYVDDTAAVDLRSAEANGIEVPSWTFTSSFREAFNRGVNESLRRNMGNQAMLRHVKLLSVQDAKVLVTTRGTR
jgi:hypothetical protein